LRYKAVEQTTLSSPERMMRRRAGFCLYVLSSTLMRRLIAPGLRPAAQVWRHAHTMAAACGRADKKPAPAVMPERVLPLSVYL
jgi:hypothetical protein